MKERLKARGNFDDQEDTIMKRIITYQEQTKPVVEAYMDSLIKVNDKNLCIAYHCIIINVYTCLKILLEGTAATRASF